MDNWDDLRLFLATARTGSSRKAAAALGINQSTVSRRIRDLESRTGVRLFDRRPGGLVLSDAGEDLMSVASEVEMRVADVDRTLHGRDVLMAGSIRLSLPDMFVAHVAAHLAQFAANHPQVDLEVIVDNDLVSLTRREADLALRLGGSPPSQLLGRRIAPAHAAIYVSSNQADSVTHPVDPKALQWVCWEERYRGFPTETWIADNIPSEQVRARVNTSLAHAELVAHGAGAGFQLCYLGDADPRMLRVGPPIDFGMTVWLLTHDDLKRTARVRALMRFLGDALASQRHRFLGQPDEP